MLKMGTNNHNFRLNIATDKKYTLKNGFEVENPLFHIFYNKIFFVTKYEPSGIKKLMRPFWKQK